MTMSTIKSIFFSKGERICLITEGVDQFITEAYHTQNKYQYL